MAFFGPPPPFVGATTTADGASGLVPAPASGTSTRLLYSDAKFKNISIFPQFKPPNAVIMANPYAGYGTVASSAVSPTDKVRVFSLMYFPASGNIDTLLWRTGSGPSVSYNMHIGVWRVGDDGKPSDYITGVIASSGLTGSVDISSSISSTEIEAGWAFFSLTPDATQATQSILSAGATATAFYRRQIQSSMSGTNVGGVFSYACLTSYSQTNHETFSISSTASPMCGYEYE
jgi:hypothetical protein